MYRTENDDKKTFITNLTASLFIIGLNWTLPKCSSTINGQKTMI